MFRRPLKSVLFLLVMVLLGAVPALAQKTITGTIAADTTLDTVGGAVYEVTSTVTVNAGVTLTIDPGVTLKFHPSRYLNVQGTLFAEGGSTPDSMIVFTSLKDDAAPLAAGEDTNGDGAASTPASGDWYNIRFSGAASSASSMRWCLVRYTGGGSVSALAMTSGASPTIRACDLNVGYRGIQITTAAAPTIRNTAINGMTLVPVYMTLDTNPVFENIILDAPSGNGTDAIQLYSNAVVGTANISRPSATIGGVPTNSLAYQVSATITIGAGESLNIEPGVVLKFDTNRYVSNSGLLTAFGGTTPDSLIYFTGISDDNAPAPGGQDSNVNGNTTFPAWNNWGGIHFYDSSDDASVLRNCQISFAGYYGTTYGAVYCDNASPTLRDCDLTAAYYGVKCIGTASPSLHNSSINAMQDVPVAIEISTNPTFDAIAFGSTSDNGFDAIGILGGTLSGTSILGIRGATLGATPIDNLVYIQLADITIAGGGDLTIDPGIVVKPRDNVDIFVNGALHMDGTADPDSQIVFTSYKDDTEGNPADTNNDGSNTSPLTGNWGRIRFNPGSTGSVSYATLKFGGYSQGALISAESASPDLHDLILQNSYYGIEQAGTAASVINNVDISNTTYTPLRMSISANPIYSGITFTNVGLIAIGLIPETVGVDSVLRVRSMAGFNNISYYLNGDIIVTTGTHFRMEPGIVLKFAYSSYGVDLIIDGSLQAVSTPDSTIAFTSVYDDSRGNPGDTAGDAAATVPTYNNWGYVKFGPTSDDAASIIERCDLAYGGRGYSSQPDGVIWCNSASPTIRNNYFSTNYIGVWTDGNSAPLIQDNDFFNQVQTPLATSVLANPNYVNNTFNQNGIHAIGLINETLSADATLEKITTMGLPSYPYYNLGTTEVGVGTILTIEPGVIVKVRASTNAFNVRGGIQAVGTAGDRIILTSIKDDSQGGDSNVDGAASSPASGNWYGMYFYDSADDANCRIEQCLFRFGGLGYLINCQSASPTIVNNEFELCTYGIYMYNDSAPVIQNNLFRVLTWYPIAKSVLSQPVFGGNVLDNVNYECIGIIGESIGQDMTMQKWDFAGYTNITQALVGTALTVQLGATLTMEPGLVFKMLSQSYHPFSNAINVYGSLVADGTELDPIILTSVKDDTVGNPADTNGDGAGTLPAKGNWAYVYFDEVSDDATAILDNCELRYGYNSSTYGMVRCNSASPTISNCSFNNAYYAISIRGDSSPLFTNCIVDDMSMTPVLMSLTSSPQFSGNQFLAGNAYNALGIIGETLAQDATIMARDVGQTAHIPYLLLGNLTAGFSSILRIEPGVIIKSPGAYNITIQRGLIAEGGSTPDELIVFTSATDDFYGGDTNNDGSATASDYTRWGRVIIQNEAIDDSTRISNVVFRYGYNSPTYGTIEINSANPEIDDCVFAYNGVAIDYKGVAGDPAAGWIHNSDFISNTYYGVRNQGTAFTVDATGNWWGHTTGPLDNSDDTGTGGFYNPGGFGDPVSDRIDYGAWETTGVQNIVLGDVSRNGDVRAFDASLILQELVGPGLLGPLQLVLGDVDCTSSLMALDASFVLRYVAGLDTYFPCAIDSIPTKSEDDLPAYLTSDPVNFAADLPQISLAADEKAWVPVQVSGSGDVFGQEYHILFDPAQVSINNVRLLPAAQGSAMAWNIVGGNQLRIAIASLEPLSVADAVEFELVGNSTLEGQTSASVVLSFARLNEDEQLGASGSGDLPDTGLTRLFQNHPNPFNPMTTIKFAVGAGQNDARVQLTVFDTRGHVVRELVNERRSAGNHQVIWDGRDGGGRQVGSGLYLYKLDVGGQVLVNKMLLLK